MATSDVSFIVFAEKFLDNLSFTDSRDMTKESGAMFPPSSCSINAYEREFVCFSDTECMNK